MYTEDSDGHWPEDTLDILVKSGCLTSKEIIFTKGDPFPRWICERTCQVPRLETS